jgi:hypothetical protein
MKASHILVFTSYVCFGIGMLLGENLAGSIWWIVALVATGAGCVVLMMLPLKRKKKRLPVRRSQLKGVKSRKVAHSR